MFKKIISFALILFLAQVGSASANFLVNGSFETGDLTGWTQTDLNLPTEYPISVIITDNVGRSYPTGAFGEAVPPDNAAGNNSSDLAGRFAAYFVDDFADQHLSQSVFLSAGGYEIGFDAYAPLNGFNNAFTATFTGDIAGVTLASFDVHLQNDPQNWNSYSGDATILADGNYLVTFHYVTNGFPASDVVIDRVYIEEGEGGTPIPTPEPATMLLIGLGLVGLAGIRRKIK